MEGSIRQKAAEAVQTLFTHSKVSIYRNFHSRTEDCIPSCQTIDFSNNLKNLLKISDQIDTTEQTENPIAKESASSLPCTSYPPSTSADQTQRNEKSPKSIKHELFLFSRPKSFFF